MQITSVVWNGPRGRADSERSGATITSQICDHRRERGGDESRRGDSWVFARRLKAIIFLYICNGWMQQSHRRQVLDKERKKNVRPVI